MLASLGLLWSLFHVAVASELTFNRGGLHSLKGTLHWNVLDKGILKTGFEAKLLTFTKPSSADQAGVLHITKCTNPDAGSVFGCEMVQPGGEGALDVAVSFARTGDVQSKDEEGKDEEGKDEDQQMSCSDVKKKYKDAGCCAPGSASRRLSLEGPNVTDVTDKALALKYMERYVKSQERSLEGPSQLAQDFRNVLGKHRHLGSRLLSDASDKLVGAWKVKQGSCKPAYQVYNPWSDRKLVDDSDCGVQLEIHEDGTFKGDVSMWFGYSGISFDGNIDSMWLPDKVKERDTVPLPVSPDEAKLKLKRKTEDGLEYFTLEDIKDRVEAIYPHHAMDEAYNSRERTAITFKYSGILERDYNLLEVGDAGYPSSFCVVLDDKKAHSIEKTTDECGGLIWEITDANEACSSAIGDPKRYYLPDKDLEKECDPFSGGGQVVSDAPLMSSPSLAAFFAFLVLGLSQPI